MHSNQVSMLIVLRLFACLVFVELLGLASIAVLSSSWLLLGVSHIFDTILVFFAVWLTNFF